MSDWSPKLKFYPHFDDQISPEKVEALVKNPERVAQNSFYPFLRYEQRWQPFRGKSRKSGEEKPAKKSRPIRFASRRDAYIYSYYRHLLTAPYEDALKIHGLCDSVIAYRKIKSSTGQGKSNIDFANDAFLAVAKLGNCAAIALDISSFFETLDHAVLKKAWCRVLGEETLPIDHQAVFRAMTQYAVVDLDAAYQRLGFSEEKVIKGRKRTVYTHTRRDMPKKLCSNSDFRNLICGRDGKHESLVEKNRKPYGIPQWSPISDMLANIYMLEFDIALNGYCKSLGGVYFRYSDDILMIIPGAAERAEAACAFAKSEISKYGNKLNIKDKKTSAVAYQIQSDGTQSYQHIIGTLGRNGLEYLGFRYDGKYARIRDATLSRLYRKIVGSIKAECTAIRKRYPGKNTEFLFEKFDFPAFFQRYGRVEDFAPEDGHDSWTFWTYARRAVQKFGRLGRPISHQLRNFKLVVKTRVRRELAKGL